MIEVLKWTFSWDKGCLSTDKEALSPRPCFRRISIGSHRDHHLSSLLRYSLLSLGQTRIETRNFSSVFEKKQVDQFINGSQNLLQYLLLFFDVPVWSWGELITTFFLSLLEVASLRSLTDRFLLSAKELSSPDCSGIRVKFGGRMFSRFWESLFLPSFDWIKLYDVFNLSNFSGIFNPDIEVPSKSSSFGWYRLMFIWGSSRERKLDFLLSDSFFDGKNLWIMYV